jgi:hypothetical protein
MFNFKLIILFLLVPTIALATPPTRTYNYVSNATIDPNQNNTNENAIYSYLQVGVDTYAPGSISSSAINANAAIAYSQLSLSNSILNADINSSAAIVASKLDLTSPGAIGSVAPNTGAFTTLSATGTVNLGTTHQGDVFYDNGTSVVRQPPGTLGQVLQTGGAGANPSWVNSLSSVSDYGTSSSVSTAYQGTNTKIAYGNISVANKSSTNITNLPFTSSTSYKCTCNQVAGNLGNMNGPCAVAYSSGSQVAIENASDTTFVESWICIGT